MELTERYKLKKPGQDDYYDVQDFNANADAIDAALGQHDEDIDNVFRVGDLRSTLRTDLGDRWLLCNGEAFDPAEYPELAEILPGGLASMGTKAKSRAVGSRPDANWELGAYATDGVTQLAAYTYKSTSTGAATTDKIYWSSNNFKSVTTKTVQSPFHRIRLFFANGHWIAFAGTLGTTYALPTLTGCYASAEPFVDFSGRVSMTGNTKIHDVLHVEYANGLYYAFCVTYEVSSADTIYLSLRVLASASPDFQNSSVTTVRERFYTYNNSVKSVFQFFRTESNYIFFVWQTNKLKYISWSSAPAGPYQWRALTATDQSAVNGVSPPRFVDGKYVWVGSASKPGAGSTKYETLAYLGDLESGAVTYVYLAFTQTTASGACGLVDCGDGTYAFFSYRESYIYVAQGDIFQAANWTRGATSAAAETETGGTAYERDGTVNVSTASGILSIPKAAVPTVSISNCYTYIKAK